MRSAELLNALSQHREGITIHMCKGHKVRVETRYSPIVIGIGDTLFTAALDCANWIYDVLKDYPECEKDIPDVMKALRNYENVP
jgi:hypothetical protein